MRVTMETRSEALTTLCQSVRELSARCEYDTCAQMVCQAMADYPFAPQPHNLLGVLLEHTGDHVNAMRQFRAAMDLDPTYAPARQNLSTYGTFCSSGAVAFDECDCPGGDCRVEYDSRGVGRVVRRK